MRFQMGLEKQGIPYKTISLLPNIRGARRLKRRTADAILLLLIAGTTSFVLWRLFKAFGSTLNEGPSLFASFDPSPSSESTPLSTKKPATHTDICTSKGCTRAASFLMSSIDPTVDPCEDFYQFSCGGYIKDHPLARGSIGISAREDLIQAFEARMIEFLLDMRYNEESSISDRQAAKLFQSCLRADQNGIKPFTPTIKEAGGLPFNAGVRPEWEKMIELLGFEHFPLWNVVLVNGVMHLQTPRLQLPSYLKNLKGYLDKRTRLFARDSNVTSNEPVLKSELNSFIELFKDIEKIKKGNVLENTIKGKAENSFNFSLDEAMLNFPSFPWMTLAKFYDLSSIRFVGELNYTKEVYKLWQDDMLNYYMKDWYLSNFLEAHLVQFGAEYRDLYQDVFGFEKSVTSYCIAQVETYMPRWTDVFFSENVANLKDYAVIKDLATNIKEAWMENMLENDLLEPLTKLHTTEKIFELSMNFGYWVPLYSREELDALYVQFGSIGSQSFFDFTQRLRTIKIAGSYKGVSDLASFYSRALGSPDQIFLLAGILQEPIFADDYPPELNYGALGAIVGREITKTFEQNERLIQKLFAGSNGHEFDYVSKSTHVETAKDIIGLKAAFRAYRKERALLYGDDPVKLPGLGEYNNDQLFFISFSQVWCSKETKEESLVNPTGDRLLGKTRINEAVKNFEAFGSAFSCKPGCPMNPQKKCHTRHQH